MISQRILLFSVFLRCYLVEAQFNKTLYHEMPPMHVIEDYDGCLASQSSPGVKHGSNIPATYCMVYAEIKPNETSALWHQIANFSADHKRHYRHDHIFFGVCLEKCMKLLQPFSRFHRQQLYGGNVQDQELIDIYADVHKRETDQRVHYDRMISSCLNYDFHHKYNLSLYTSIEYCETSNGPLKNDFLDYVVYVIFAVITMLNILSTTYDYNLKNKQPAHLQNNDFYKANLRTRADVFLTSFSICRNYFAIIQPSTGSMAKELNFFNAYRVVSIFLVIFAHVIMLIMAVQIKNPDFFEQFYYNVETSIVQNGSSIIQIFFVMSGFLLNVNMHERQLITRYSKMNTCFRVYFKLLAFRYLRLAPSMGLLVLFNATLLGRMQDGPFWRHFTEAERVFCRKYWWKNIFFVNNYLMERSCAHHTWYIAADMQLFELFALIIVLVKKYPKIKKFLYTVIMICAIMVPALITYFLKLDAIYHLAPENYRYLYFKNAEIFYQMYAPFYTNIGGYMCGIISADIYLKYKKNVNQFKGILKYELLWWIIPPLAVAILFTGAIFMSNEFPKPSIWMALYAGLYRNIWCILCCMSVMCMCFKLGWIAYEFCNLSIFRPLARISYQSYIWHIVVLRILGGHYRQPIYVNRLSLICDVMLGFVFTNIVALFFAIFLEFPLGAVQKCFTHNEKGNKQAEVETFSLHNTRADGLNIR